MKKNILKTKIKGRMCMDWLCPYRKPKQLIRVFSKEDIRFDCDITDISEKSMNCTAKCGYGEMLENNKK